MKKGLFIIAGAALVLSSCQEDGIRNDINNTVEEAISFETFAQKAVRAENSGATATNGLAQYHDNFAVWGSKYINDEEQTPVVFENQLVKYASSDGGKWQYSPVRFWDKSANKYDFYAAAPASESWVFDNTTKKFTLSNFSVDNVSLAVGTACSADAVMPNNKDIMIATDAFANPATDSKTKVHLLFNHILSRMNIAVKKGDVLKDYIVRLDKVMISEMLKTGSFDESRASGNALASGSVARWTNTSTKEDFGYNETGDNRLKVASSDTYVYQGLIIPQTVDYKSIKLDGTDASGDAYILIAYTMYTASGDAEIAVPGGKYEYYYNLADIFIGNGAASGDAVDFCEGWMNTLKITINPDAIEFIADAYEWDEKEPVEVDVPDINK